MRPLFSDEKRPAPATGTGLFVYAFLQVRGDASRPQGWRELINDIKKDVRSHQHQQYPAQAFLKGLKIMRDNGQVVMHEPGE